MASLDSLVPFMDKGHEDALSFIREYGHPEDIEVLDMIRGNAISPSIHAPEVMHVFHGVMNGAVARTFRKHIEESAPRKRGRPRKENAA